MLRDPIIPLIPSDQMKLEKQVKRSITNIAELFESLSVGWVDGSQDNRCLVAGEGIQFVRASRRYIPHGFFLRSSQDIPVTVLKHGYSMRGFIQFEAHAYYRGMFKTESSDDRFSHSAYLTLAGYQFGQLGVFDVAHLHRDIAACPFFNPPATDAGVDLMLSESPKNRIDHIRIGV